MARARTGRENQTPRGGSSSGRTAQVQSTEEARRRERARESYNQRTNNGNGNSSSSGRQHGGGGSASGSTSTGGSRSTSSAPAGSGWGEGEDRRERISTGRETQTPHGIGSQSQSGTSSGSRTSSSGSSSGSRTSSSGTSVSGRTSTGRENQTPRGTNRRAESERGEVQRVQSQEEASRRERARESYNRRPPRTLSEAHAEYEHNRSIAESIEEQYHGRMPDITEDDRYAAEHGDIMAQRRIADVQKVQNARREMDTLRALENEYQKQDRETYSYTPENGDKAGRAKEDPRAKGAEKSLREQYVPEGFRQPEGRKLATYDEWSQWQEEVKAANQAVKETEEAIRRNKEIAEDIKERNQLGREFLDIVPGWYKKGMQIAGGILGNPVSNVIGVKDAIGEAYSRHREAKSMPDHAKNAAETKRLEDLLKSRKEYAETIEKTGRAPERTAPEVKDPHAGQVQVYNPMNGKDTWMSVYDLAEGIQNYDIREAKTGRFVMTFKGMAKASDIKDGSRRESTLADGDMPFIWPIYGNEWRVSSGYGPRTPFVTNTGKMSSSFHPSIDIAAPGGTPIHSIADGKVIFSGFRSGYGYTIEIQHPDGTISKYHHMQEASPMHVGDTVGQGSVVGKVGQTGNSTGNHLDITIVQNGKTIDPQKILGQATPVTGEAGSLGKWTEGLKAAYTERFHDKDGNALTVDFAPLSDRVKNMVADEADRTGNRDRAAWILMPSSVKEAQGNIKREEERQASAPKRMIEAAKEKYTQTVNDGYGMGNIYLKDRTVNTAEGKKEMPFGIIGYEENGKTVLLPTVVRTEDGYKQISEQDAAARYLLTGEYLGKFDNMVDAAAYAEVIGDTQAHLGESAQKYAADMQKATKYNIGEWAAAAVDTGARQPIKQAADTLYMIGELAASDITAKSAGFQKLFGIDTHGEKASDAILSGIGKVDNWTSGMFQEAALRQAKASGSRGGGWWNVGGNLIQNQVAMLPFLLVSSIEAPTAAAAEGANLLQKAGVLASNMAKNPSFWYTFATTVGSEYKDAREAGASENAAATAALLASIPNAGIEISFGIGSSDWGKASGNVLASLVKTGFDEGKEEIMQGIVSRSIAKLIYDHDRDWWDTQAADAVFNPKTSLVEGGYGFAGGFLATGGHVILNTSAVAIGTAAQKAAVIQSTGADLFKTKNGVQATINDGLLMPQGERAYTNAVKLKARVDAGKNISANQIGTQSYYNSEAARKVNAGTASLLSKEGKAELQAAAADAGVTDAREANRVIQYARPIPNEMGGVDVSEWKKNIGKTAQVIATIQAANPNATTDGIYDMLAAEDERAAHSSAENDGSPVSRSGIRMARLEVFAGRGQMTDGYIETVAKAAVSAINKRMEKNGSWMVLRTDSAIKAVIARLKTGKRDTQNQTLRQAYDAAYGIAWDMIQATYASQANEYERLTGGSADGFRAGAEEMLARLTGETPSGIIGANEGGIENGNFGNSRGQEREFGNNALRQIAGLGSESGTGGYAGDEGGTRQSAERILADEISASGTEYEKSSRGQTIVGKLHSIPEHKKTRSMKIIERVYQRKGLTVRWATNLKFQNAKSICYAAVDLQTGEVILPLDTDRNILFTAFHELGHTKANRFGEHSQAYHDLVEAVYRAVIEKGSTEEYDALLSQYEANYKSLYAKGVAPDSAEYLKAKAMFEEELMVDIAAQVILDQEMTEAAFGEHAGAVLRAANALYGENLREAVDSFAEEEVKEAPAEEQEEDVPDETAPEPSPITEEDIQDLMEEYGVDRETAEQFAREARVAAGVRYLAERIDSNGEPYWNIETEDDIFRNIKNKKDLQKAALDYIVNGAKHMEVSDIIDGEPLTFWRMGAKEYVYGRQTSLLRQEEKETGQKLYSKKLRIAPSIDDLIRNATVSWPSPDAKNHQAFPYGWRNYRGRVRLDDVIFHYVVRVGEAKNGHVFYDINLEVDHTVPDSKTASRISRSTSDDNKVSQNETVVNNHSMQNSENDTDIHYSADVRYMAEDDSELTDPGDDDTINMKPVDDAICLIPKQNIVFVGMHDEMCRDTEFRELYNRAKVGSKEAAAELANKYLSSEYIGRIKQKYNGASIIPVMGKEGTSDNVMPHILVRFISEVTGMQAYNGIIKTSQNEMRGKSAKERILEEITYSFDEGYSSAEIQGKQFVIFDDCISTGNTTFSLRNFIESNGGSVVGYLSLTKGKDNTDHIEITQKEFQTLSQLTGGEYDDILKRITSRQARTLIQHPEIISQFADAARSARDGGKNTEGGGLGNGKIATSDPRTSKRTGRDGSRERKTTGISEQLNAETKSDDTDGGAATFMPENAASDQRYMKAVDNPKEQQRIIDMVAEESFPDSKARKGGKLIHLYHGTGKGSFHSFDLYNKGRYGLFGIGIYTTESRDVAESYSTKRGKKPYVFDLYGNAENPLDMDAPADVSKWNKALEEGELWERVPEGSTNEQAFRILEDELSDMMLPEWEGEEIVTGILEGMGYDSITHMGGGRVDPNGERHRVWIFLHPEQVKLAAPTMDDSGNMILPSQRFRMGTDDIRYSAGGDKKISVGMTDEDAAYKESQEKYKGKSLTEDKEVYSYSFLTQLPDLTVIQLPSTSAINTSNGKIDTKKVVDNGMKNARSMGEEQNGKVFVKNQFTGKRIQITRESIRHGLSGSYNRLLTNSRIGSMIGDVVQNSVPVNSLTNVNPSVQGTYAMAAYLQDAKGREFVAIVTIEQWNDEVQEFNLYDVAHAVSGRQKNSGFLGTKPQGLNPLPAAKISVADFLRIVKSTHQSILSNDVLVHFGEKRKGGYYADRIKFSTSSTIDSTEKETTNPLEPLVETYGAIPKGENPVREVEVPKQTSPKMYTSLFARTAMESNAVPDEMQGDFAEMVASGKMSHERLPNQVAANHAAELVRERGFEGALRDWQGYIRSGETLSPNQLAVGQLLFNMAADAKNTDLAMKLASDLAVEATKAGRSVQAFRLLKTMTPEGQLYTIEKQVEKINRELDETAGKKGKKREKITLSGDAANRILNAKDKTALDQAVQDAEQEIADQLPVTLWEKFKAWRYLSMLANPRTHIRNIIGNAAFVPAVGMKNAIGTVIERTTPKEQRTKAFHATKEAREFAKADFEQMVPVLTGQSKYNVQTGIEGKKKIFKTPFLEKIREFNGDALEGEDLIFLRHHYVNSLAKAITARGYDISYLTSGTKQANRALEEIREYAVREAQRATYRDVSKVAEALNKFQHMNKVAEVAVDSFVPFKQTPVNIMKRGVEYSPIGVIKGMVELAKSRRTGETAKAIDSVSAGLSGTGLMVFAMLLAHFGILRGSKDDDDKVAMLEELQGIQDYSIKIGDYSYTLDWLAPMSMPMFVGVELMRIIDEGGISFGDAIDAIARIGDPLYEMTMLQGLQSAFRSVSYSGEGPLTNVMEQMVLNYFGQAVPTLFGQFARTIDGTRRMTYTPSNSPVPKVVSRMVQQQEAKIPGLSRLLEPRVDNWGREKKYEGNWVVRAISNFFSPGYISKDGTSEVEAELERLYRASGDSGVLPSSANKYFSLDGETKYLTGAEYTQYAKERGSVSYEAISRIIATPAYQNASDEDRAAIVGNAYVYANSVAKARVSSYQPDGWVAKQKASGLSVADYIAAYTLVHGVEGDKYVDANGEEQGYKNSRNANREEALREAIPGISDEKVSSFLETLGGRALDDGERAALEQSKSAGRNVSDTVATEITEAQKVGIDADTYMQVFDAVKDVHGDKDENGKSVYLSKSRKVKAIIDEMLPDLGQAQRETLYEQFDVSNKVW